MMDRKMVALRGSGISLQFEEGKYEEHFKKNRICRSGSVHGGCSGILRKEEEHDGTEGQAHHGDKRVFPAV